MKGFVIVLVLVFSLPCVAIAEQPSTEVSDAQLTGERDAQANAKMERFFMLGACAGSCLTFVGCCFLLLSPMMYIQNMYATT